MSKENEFLREIKFKVHPHLIEYMSFLEKFFKTKMPEVAAMKNDERKKMRPFGAL